MTTQELLQRRKKVMIKYPDSPFDVGEILMQRTSNSKVFRKLNDHSIGVIADDFPDIFKEMNWWEERDEKDLPEYLKLVMDNKIQFVHKVESWNGVNDYGQPLYEYINKVNYQTIACVSELEPATKEEHEQYLSLQKQQS